MLAACVRKMSEELAESNRRGEGWQAALLELQKEAGLRGETTERRAQPHLSRLLSLTSILCPLLLNLLLLISHSPLYPLSSPPLSASPPVFRLFHLPLLISHSHFIICQHASTVTYLSDLNPPTPTLFAFYTSLHPFSLPGICRSASAFGLLWSLSWRSVSVSYSSKWRAPRRRGRKQRRPSEPPLPCERRGALAQLVEMWKGRGEEWTRRGSPSRGEGCLSRGDSFHSTPAKRHFLPLSTLGPLSSCTGSSSCWRNARGERAEGCPFAGVERTLPGEER